MTSQEAVVLRIRELCQQKSLSFYRLAYLSAIPKSSLLNILHGTNPTITTINKICGGFDMSLQEFFSSDLFSDCDDFD